MPPCHELQAVPPMPPAICYEMPRRRCASASAALRRATSAVTRQRFARCTVRGVAREEKFCSALPQRVRAQRAKRAIEAKRMMRVAARCYAASAPRGLPPASCCCRVLAAYTRVLPRFFFMLTFDPFACVCFTLSPRLPLIFLTVVISLMICSPSCLISLFMRMHDA